MEFARSNNKACLEALGNPQTSSTYQRVLEVLESKDRIPFVSQFGHDEDTGQAILFNFWKDANNPKGLWRQTTMESYKQKEQQPEWKTVLDVDKLAEKDGIGFGRGANRCLVQEMMAEVASASNELW